MQFIRSSDALQQQQFSFRFDDDRHADKIEKQFSTNWSIQKDGPEYMIDQSEFPS